jgi:hypothetical protein
MRAPGRVRIRHAAEPVAGLPHLALPGLEAAFRLAQGHPVEYAFHLKDDACEYVPFHYWTFRRRRGPQTTVRAGVS